MDNDIAHRNVLNSHRHLEQEIRAIEIEHINIHQVASVLIIGRPDTRSILNSHAIHRHTDGIIGNLTEIKIETLHFILLFFIILFFVILTVFTQVIAANAYLVSVRIDNIDLGIKFSNRNQIVRINGLSSICSSIPINSKTIWLHSIGNGLSSARRSIPINSKTIHFLSIGSHSSRSSRSSIYNGATCNAIPTQIRGLSSRISR